MSLFKYASTTVFGVAIASTLIVTLPQRAQALSGEEVNDIAREVTVLIRGKDRKEDQGSGVIIAKDGDQYFVLSNEHVLRHRQDYQLRTPDRKTYEVSYEEIKFLSAVDLAIAKFTTKEKYPTAKISVARLKEGQSIFISGWPKPDAIIAMAEMKTTDPQIIRQFTGGNISGFLESPIGGYEVSYDNVTRAGMSGSGIFDSSGRVIGIHGLGGAEDPIGLSQRLNLEHESAEEISALFKSGFNYGIPIGTFESEAQKKGVDLQLQKENAVAEPLKEPYVPKAEPEDRDVIKNLDEELKSRAQSGAGRVRNKFRIPWF